MKKPLRGKLYRVKLYDAAGVEHANVFVAIEQRPAGEVLVTLQFDYPDFTVAQGWKVELARYGCPACPQAKGLVVQAAHGRTLICLEV